MELKHHYIHRLKEGSQLLIVPYGIETEYKYKLIL